MCPQDFFFENAGATGAMRKKEWNASPRSFSHRHKVSESESKNASNRERERARERERERERTGADTEAGKPPTVGNQRKLHKQTLRKNLCRELFPKLRKRTLRKILSGNYCLKITNLKRNPVPKLRKTILKDFFFRPWSRNRPAISSPRIFKHVYGHKDIL